MTTSNQQILEQQKTNKTIRIFKHIKNGKRGRKIQKIQEHFEDFSLTKNSIKDFVIKNYHLGSVDHYYHNQPNSQTVLEKIKNKVQEIEKIMSNNIIIIEHSTKENSCFNIDRIETMSQSEYNASY